MRPESITMRIADKVRVFPSVARGRLWEVNIAEPIDQDRQIVQFFVGLVAPTIADSAERLAVEQEIRDYYGLSSGIRGASVNAGFTDEHRARINEDFLTFMRRQRGSAS